MRRAGKRIVLEVVGWSLIVVGIAALVLPGPGLLALFAGMLVLSQQYEWANQRVDLVRDRAMEAAEYGVQSWPRILLSVVGALSLIVVGVVWGLQPAVPTQWPLPDSLWLAGGWGTGVILIASGLFAFGLLGYSYRRFRSPSTATPTPPGPSSGR